VDHLASSDAEVVTLESGARESRRLLNGGAHVHPVLELTPFDKSET
jgi:hypothetical protein